MLFFLDAVVGEFDNEGIRSGEVLESALVRWTGLHASGSAGWAAVHVWVVAEISAERR